MTPLETYLLGSAIVFAGLAVFFFFRWRSAEDDLAENDDLIYRLKFTVDEWEQHYNNISARCDKCFARLKKFGLEERE